MPTLVVYGATSYTATQHLLPYLATHPEADKFDLVLAGRNTSRLDAANALLPGSTRKIVTLTLDDTPAVEALVKRADAVINLAGPYSKHNAEALVAACAKLGKHYLDLTGEVWWLKGIVHKYDYLASKTGACIVPMCGFEAVPGDISIYYALHCLQKREGRGTAFKSSTNYYDISGGMSGGTVASIKAFADAGEPTDIDEWALVASSVKSGHKNPPLELVHTGPKLPGVPTYGAWYLGGATNRAAYRRSWFLSRLRGSSVARKDNHSLDEAEEMEPIHGPEVHFEEALARSGKMQCTSYIGTWLLSVVLLLGAGLYISSSFIRRLFENMIPQPGQGPSKEVCENGWTRCTNVSYSDGDKQLTVVTQYDAKGDPGYSHTAKLIGEAALCLILEPLPGTAIPPFRKIGGVLTPSTAGGMAFIERLRKHNVVSLESQIYDGEQEAKKTI